jgi:uncharacterized membrane protein YbhN (UPF0104 family)
MAEVAGWLGRAVVALLPAVKLVGLSGLVMAMVPGGRVLVQAVARVMVVAILVMQEQAAMVALMAYHNRTL